MYLHIIMDGERTGFALTINWSEPPPPGEILEEMDGPGHWRIEKVADRGDGAYDMYVVAAPLEALVDMYDLRDGHTDGGPFVASVNRSDLPPGWFYLARQLVEDLIRLGWDRQVLQIKEKFGTMRVYISQRSDVLRDRIHAAQEQSGTVCQECGEPGIWFDEGWMSTLCDPCRSRLRAEYARA